MLIVKLLIDQEITHLLACIAWIFFRCATVFSCITSLLNLSWHVYFLALHFTREPHLICTAGTSTYPGQSDWTLFNPWLSRGKKGLKICQAYLHCKYHYSTLFDVLKCLPEKIAYISWRNNWFPCEITSDKRAQKFLTDDASLLRGYCFWLAETNFPSWHDQSEALLRSG